MNRRQRKKPRVGEFRELVFEVRLTFSRELDLQAWHEFMDQFIEQIKSMGLIAGGPVGR